MIYVKTFEEYNNELIVEKLNLGGLFTKLKNTVNKAPVASLIAGALLTVFTVSQAANFVSNQNILNGIEKSEIFKFLKVKDNGIDNMNTIKDVEVKIGNDDIYDTSLEVDKLEKKILLDPLSLKLSDDGLEHIKAFEKLRLTAYDNKDGMITIGYGHAERKRNSKYKEGDTITENDANDIFRKDIKIAEDGVKRLFKRWENDDINIKLTQNQYDVIVSMAFNMGVRGLLRTKFIQDIKAFDMKEASKKLKYTGAKKGFPGIRNRRAIEYKTFTS